MYKAIQEKIKDFLRASITNDLKNYDFEDFFTDFMPLLERKLAEHGLLEFEDYLNHAEEFYSFDDLEQYTIKTNYIHFDNQNIKDAILKGQFEALKKVFSKLGTFQDLKVLHSKLLSREKLKLKEKIFLLDECIHAEHVTGAIIEDCNINDLKEDIEQEYKDGILVA